VVGARGFAWLLLGRLGALTLEGNGANVLMKGEAMMGTRNEAAWIDANVDAVENYLKNEFENFAITHHADRPLTHTCIVDDRKKQFSLVIRWPILAE